MRKILTGILIIVSLVLSISVAEAAIIESDYYVVDDFAFLMGPDPALFAVGDPVHVFADVDGTTVNSFSYYIESSVSGSIFEEEFTSSTHNLGFTGSMVYGIGLSSMDHAVWNLSDDFFTRNYKTQEGVLLESDGFNFNATPVPIPGTIFLLGFGIAGLFGYRKSVKS